MGRENFVPGSRDRVITDRLLLLCASLVLSLLACLVRAEMAWSADRAEELVASFEARRDALIASLAREPLVKAAVKPPIREGRGAFARDYSYSIVNFAMKSFWLDEFNEEANAAIRENCRFYMADHHVRDEHDSFYWSADVLCRLVEFFGERGSRAAGRLDAESERIVLEMMWGYCHDNSRRADAEYANSRTWHLSHSENHHHQMISALWHFSRLLAARPDYAERSYADGGTPREHAAAWTDYAKEYLRERVRKGLFVELASKGYNVYTLKGIYNWHDFADDHELRRLARATLDLHWACWAQEQIDGTRGGAASRVYNGVPSLTAAGDNIARIASHYLGWPSERKPIENDFTPLTSQYRMPPLVVDLALSVDERGVYEVRQRAMGLAEPNFADSPDYRLRIDDGGITRYAYCAPEFVMGTALLEPRPRADWVTISAQNRWHGVIFAGHPDTRIVPECVGEGRRNSRTHNAQWSAQHAGALIVQKLRSSAQANAMRVWFAGNGLSDPVERDGWAFVEAAGAYAAARPARGGHSWEEVDSPAPGRWMLCHDEWTPVILEVARKSDFENYAAFQEAVVTSPRRFVGPTLEYRSLSGSAFEFDSSQARPPRINGKPLDYAPPLVFDSPFVRSKWNSGVAHLKFRGREMTIDVNSP